MAAYYSSLSSQRGDLQSPCPGNQKDSSFPEMHSHLGSLTTYMQQASAAASYSEIMSGNSFSSHNATEFPSVEARNEMMFIPPTNDAVNLQSIDGQLNTAANNSNGDPQLLPRMQIAVLEGEQNFQCQGLSLSLGTQMQSAATMSAAYQYQLPNVIFPSSFGMHQQTPGNWTLQRESDEGDQSEDLRNSDCLSGFAGDGHNCVKTEVISNPQYQVGHKDAYTDTYLYGQLGKANTLLNSKYLKAAQQLLDEVVNVKKAVKQPESKKCIDGSKQPDQGPGDTSNEKPSDPNESTANSSSELSSAERQDLHNKKAKLLSMVDEVDRRYRQYYHQMQVVVSSLDMVAGHGAAKSYTALALQTISRHFRCLRDAISGQIEVIRKKLGEQDSASNGQKGIPRLRYVDHQLRQQRAFQQFGVMRHAWRPQRGLPESSVSILRAWLFEHFLHPYPNDSEKLMLARQTGLSRNQVANWFINARVRLWKPMVEEMYKEEFGESEENSKSALDEAIKAHGENHSVLESRPEEDDGFRTGRQVHDSKPNDHIPDLEMNKPVAKTMLQNWSNGDSDMDSGIMKFQRDQRLNNRTDDHSTLYPDQSIPRNQNGDGSLLSAAAADTYDISELSGFGVGSHVSLALGLQHHVNDAFSISGNNMAGAASSVGPDGVDYHCMDPGKQQDRFGSSHLLHDFVV